MFLCSFIIVNGTACLIRGTRRIVSVDVIFLFFQAARQRPSEVLLAGGSVNFRFSFSPSGPGFYHGAVNARSFFSIFPKVFLAGQFPDGKIDLKEKQHRYF